MTTAIVTSVINHTTNAGFQAWGAEFHAALVAIGLTLTSDTGQINWTTVVLPAANTAAGYEIWRFNDTLQSTTPVFIKLEFGSSAATTGYPMIWITIGNGSNGSGTLTGLTSTRYKAGLDSLSYPPTIVSTSTSYVSRFCYNATLGFFGFVWKTSAQVSGCGTCSAFVFRSNDTTGAPTPTTVSLLSGNTLATASVPLMRGAVQTLNYGTGFIYPAAGLSQTQGTWYSNHPFALLSTAYSGGTSISIDPVIYLTPSTGVSVCLGRALLAEVGLGVSVTATLVGSTPHTYIQVGCPFPSIFPGLGTPTTATSFTGSDAGYQGLNSTVLGMVMLWE